MSARVLMTYQCDICGHHHNLGVACPFHYPSQRWAKHLTYHKPVYAPTTATPRLDAS